MILLSIAFIASVLALMWLAETDIEPTEHRHINRLADASRKRRTGRAHKYTRAGIQ